MLRVDRAQPRRARMFVVAVAAVTALLLVVFAAKPAGRADADDGDARRRQYESAAAVHAHENIAAESAKSAKLRNSKPGDVAHDDHHQAGGGGAAHGDAHHDDGLGLHAAELGRPVPTPLPTPAATAAKVHRFPRVEINTEHGAIVFELRPNSAPKTVANFLKLVKSGWYNGTALYRYERGFCLQGGGWPSKQSPFPPVPMEYKLPNKKWAVSMARGNDPGSATSEFSIMLGDNSKWLGPGGGTKDGYAVFAEVVAGFDVIEALGKLPTRKAGLTMFAKPVTILYMLPSIDD